ncbi:MAG: hypothetical protein KDK35_03335 [Leptospiraceae bacterium]|nr:hypothetical protein [Leptospiraceae bacterium]
MAPRLEEARLRSLWKANPSAQEGYTRNYSTETADGDIISVDFNFARQMVRIALSVAREHHRQYIAVIKSGTVLQERELAGKRSLDLTSRIAPVAGYFRFLPDEMLLRSIGGNYGVPLLPDLPGSSYAREHLPIHPLRQKFQPLRSLRRYLTRKRERALRPRGPVRRFFRRLPAEIWDLTLGGLLCLAYTWGGLNLTELAGYLGVAGLVCGAWDWVWRQRDPFMPKVLAFMAASGFAVYMQVQHRMWAIFL